MLTVVKPSAAKKSPLSPVEKFTDMPKDAPNSLKLFSTTSSDGRNSASSSSSIPQLLEIELPKPVSIAYRMAVSRLVKELSAARTSATFAPGATVCDHCTSSVVSSFQPQLDPQEVGPLG